MATNKPAPVEDTAIHPVSDPDEPPNSGVADSETFMALMGQPEPVPVQPVVVVRKTGKHHIRFTGNAALGEAITIHADALEKNQRVWFQVKGPDTDERTRARQEGNQAYGRVMITRHGRYTVGIEADGRLVGEVVFDA